jgi:uncharacterized protein YbjQ (UPF0145 family)
MPLPLITVQSFNQNTLQAAGAVFVHRVEAVSVSRGLLGGITGAAAGRNEAMEKKMNDLTQALLNDLDTQAKKMYPSAIGLVNADIDFTISGQDASMMLIGKASATVLIKRVKPLTMAPTAPAAPLIESSAPIGFSSQPPLQPSKDPQLFLKGMPLSSDPQVPMRGGKKTFISKRSIKSSRKNRK